MGEYFMTFQTYMNLIDYVWVIYVLLLLTEQYFLFILPGYITEKLEEENTYIPKEVLWTCNVFRLNSHKHTSTHPVINTTYQFPLPNSSWLLIIHSRWNEWTVKPEAKSFKLISTSRFFFFLTKQISRLLLRGRRIVSSSIPSLLVSLLMKWQVKNIKRVKKAKGEKGEPK